MKKYIILFLQTLATICICTSVIIISLYIVLEFTPLYKFDIKYLNIESKTKLNTLELSNNYRTMTDYLIRPTVSALQLPNYKLTTDASTHFQEVRTIFVDLKQALYLCIILGLILVIYLTYKRHFTYYKYTSLSLAAVPLLLSIPFLINFNKSFTLFHKIVFKNNYWQFDPTADPVINMLPEQFFCHCAMLILFLLVFFSLCFALLYKALNKKRNSAVR